MKHYDDGASLTQKLLSGIDILADNVASTLGPRGRNVILQDKKGAPIITKDGVTVAEFVTLEDPFQNAAVEIIKQASRKTNSEAGDGTTTATVLARAIFKEAHRHVLAGVSPIEVNRGVSKATAEVVQQLEALSRPIQSLADITHIARISANNDSVIGELVAKAVDCAGQDGSIVVEEARSLDTTLDLIEGFRFDSGFAASAFITDERRGAVVYENPLILVADCKIDNVQDILPVLEVVAREGRPLVIIASEIEGQALAALIMNSVRGSMKVAAAKAPRYGQERRSILGDLCAAVGADFVTKSAGLELKDVKLGNLGTCKKIDIAKNGTVIIGGNGNFEEIDKRIESLKVEIGNTENMHECEILQERITRLSSGVSVIKVGAATEVEMIEKKHRIEDAIEAVKSAQLEGIVPGGGVALLRASAKCGLDEELPHAQRIGFEIVRAAIQEPIRQIAQNCGLSPDIIVREVLELDDSQGYDFSADECGVDLYEKGIIDPVKVTRCALQNAASVAGTLITTGHAIVSREA